MATLGKLDHPLTGLYRAVREHVRGATFGCADVFGAADELEAFGVPKLEDHAQPAPPGVHLATPERTVRIDAQAADGHAGTAPLDVGGDRYGERNLTAASRRPAAACC